MFNIMIKALIKTIQILKIKSHNYEKNVCMYFSNYLCSAYDSMY